MGRKEAEVWPEEMTRQGAGAGRGGGGSEGLGGSGGKLPREPTLRKEKHRQRAESASASRSFLGKGS